MFASLLGLAEAGSVSKADRAFIHLAEIATTVRHAFVPTQLTVPGQELLFFRHALAGFGGCENLCVLDHRLLRKTCPEIIPDESLALG